MQPFKGYGKIAYLGQNGALLSLVANQIIVITLNCHIRIASADRVCRSACEFLAVCGEKRKKKTKKGRGPPCRRLGGQRNERPSAIVFFFLRKVKYIQFCNMLGGGGEHLSNCLHFSGWRTGKGHSAEQLHPVSPTHSSRARGKVGGGWGKSRFRGFYMCGLFQHMARCVQRDKKGCNPGESGVKRCPSSPPFISAAHVEFHYMDLKTCECHLFPWPWHHWWSRGDRVWCIVLFPRCPRCFLVLF